MHNTDRTALEFPYSNESHFPQGEYAVQEEIVNPYTGELNQDLEVQLAAELLSVSTEEELDQFLGGLVRKIGSGLSRFARSGAGRAVFGALKSAAKSALPTLASMGASMIPGVGPLVAPLAGQAASALGSKLGLEIEGMSHEDSQFEIARRVIRVGVDAARAIDALPEGEVMDEELWGAIAGAAKRWLPRIGGAILRGAKYVAQNSSGNVSLPLPGGFTISASKVATNGAPQQEYGGYGGYGRSSYPQQRSTGSWRRVQGGILIVGA